MLWFLLHGGGACDRLLLFYFSLRSGSGVRLFLPGNQPGCAVCRPVSDRAGILVGSLLPNMLASLVINVLLMYGRTRKFFSAVSLSLLTIKPAFARYTLAVW